MSTYEHCCESMSSFIEDERVQLLYISKYRSFGIRYWKSSSYQEIYYCPWCGTKLPSSLNEKWYDELTELDYEPYSEDIPDKYKTDAWWRSNKE